MDEKGLGQQLKAVRREKGFTQQRLCQKASLSYSTLAKIERGAIKAPSIFTVQSIASALGVSLDELLGTSSAGSNRHLKRTKSGVSFIYFDVNDTLIRASQRGFTVLSERSGILPDVIETAFWHYNDAMCRGTMSMSDLNAALGQRLGIEVDWRTIYLDSAESIPAMQELMIWTAQHYRIGLLTNTMPGLISGLRERGLLPDLPYEVIIDSSEVGTVKPEAKMYELAQERAALPAAQILSIDDTRANLVAAESHDWHVSWFDGYRADESVARLRTTLEPAE